MYDSDKKYLSRFALDPDMEYGSEDLYGTDFSRYGFYDDDAEPIDAKNLDTENLILEDDCFLE